MTDTIEVKYTLCTTKEFFSTKNDKIALDKCKECKKHNMINYRKLNPQKPRIDERLKGERNNYFKERRLKIKLEKEALASVEIL